MPAVRECFVCKKLTGNPKFCSRSCSAVNSNRVSPRRWKTKSCATCSTKIGSKLKYCKPCYLASLSIDMTLKEAIYEQHHKSSAFALVRTRARSIAKKMGWKKCAFCNYDKHVEIAHIKSISSYPLDTTISVINEESNLLPLCPNHHWEFDKGLITLEQINSIAPSTQ